MKFLTVTQVGNAVVFTYTDQADGNGAVLSIETIAKQNIGGVDGFLYVRPPLQYPIGTWVNPDDRTQGSQTQTLITLRSSSGCVIKTFDCDNAVNQTTWQGKTQTALNQAIADISSWL